MRISRNYFIAAIAAAAFAGTAAPASADPQYTADDIIAHFADVPDLGPTRSLSRTLCIGPASRCDPTPEVEAVRPFDLRITFALDSAELTQQAREDLDQFAQAITTDDKLRSYSFFVDGHTDMRGSPDYNQELSERRAQAVVAYLRRKGIDPDRLTPRGFGQSKPAVEDGFADINRRVEARITNLVQ